MWLHMHKNESILSPKIVYNFFGSRIQFELCITGAEQPFKIDNVIETQELSSFF